MEKAMHILLLDNYDSFTYNLYQYLSELGATIEVVRNDEIEVDEIRERRPDKIVISPGPCTPAEAGISIPLIRELGVEIPILGVCLGHQAIGAAFGGRVIRAPEPIHGKLSAIHHEGQGVFQNLPSPFDATRYHSLIVERESLPSELEITATTADGLIMGLRHRHLPIEGIQFHPESYTTEHGKQMLRNFLERNDQPADARAVEVPAADV
jgi:anthranilate synthase component 2